VIGFPLENRGVFQPFVAVIGGYSLWHLLVMVIVIAAAVSIIYVILGQMQVAIPSWVAQIFWILVLAFIGIAAIGFLFSLPWRL
jgi:hypothetical protein